MEKIISLIEKIENNGHEVWKSCPASDDAIQKLEVALSSDLPEALKQFLSCYGAIGIYDNFISGIIDDNPLEIEGGNIIGDTAFLREEFPNLPSSFIVISTHEYGAYCLDLSSKGGSVYNYQHGSSTLIEDDFYSFLINFLEGWANE